ncbi:hypothetical protein ABZT03_19070 [Streptomyces sp. NPDC005574]|uniref:hypothetical protein n=1 Tax=Streptomyces sp. NPDC005574 TaxID=3156891 RepID=UPI0033A1D750
MPAEILTTALYGLGQYEAAAIEHRADGLRPSTAVCNAVAWLWENGCQEEATNLIGTRPRAILCDMYASGDPTPRAHLAYSPRLRMFRTPWHRWGWGAVPLVSMSVLAFLPFAVAWRRGVPAWVPALYFLGSAIVSLGGP